MVPVIALAPLETPILATLAIFSGESCGRIRSIPWKLIHFLIPKSRNFDC